MDLNDWETLDFSELQFLALPTLSEVNDTLVLDREPAAPAFMNDDGDEFQFDLETPASISDFDDALLELVDTSPFQKTQPAYRPEPNDTLASCMLLVQPDPIDPPDTSMETEYNDYHDHIVKALNIEQLKAIVAAYQLARWKNDLQLGCQAWLDKNPTASDAEARAVKALLNPAHWRHTWLIVVAANEIIQRLSEASQIPKRWRSNVTGVAIRASQK